MTNQDVANQASPQAEQKVQHDAGVRTFYVIERGGMYFKGYDLEFGRVEFTPEIMSARWFTHTRAAKPRAGERIQQLKLNIKENTISILV